MKSTYKKATLHAGKSKRNNHEGKGPIRGFSCSQCIKSLREVDKALRLPIWHVDYEETDCGFVFLRGNFNHPHHSLMDSSAQVHAESTGRYFPSQCLEYGRVMAASGVKTPALYETFVTICKENGLPVTFDKRDVYGQFCRQDNNVKVFDATRLVETLKARVNAPTEPCN